MRSKQSHGFTLVEVMIVLGILGILGGLIYPSYQGAVRKTKRTEGKAALLQLMQQQERYFSQHGSYLAFSSASLDAEAKRFKWFSGDNSAGSAYEISGAPCAGDTLQGCILLTARPGTAKVNSAYKDEQCGELSLASSGVKSPARTECW